MGAGMARWKGGDWRTLMRLALPLLLLAAAAPAAPVRDGAGNWILALVPVKGPAWFAAKEDVQSEMRCTADRRRCVRVVRIDKDSTVEIYDGVPTTPEPAVRIAVTGEAEPYRVMPWTQIVEQVDGHWLVGTLTTQSAYYSGGRASNVTLTLYEVAAGVAEPPAVLDTLVSGSVMIRACFSETDMRDRAGACHDEYEFRGTLTLDPATSSGRPRFRLVTAARAYPRGVTRDGDNSGTRLTRRDLVWTRDPACSYARLFAWTGKAYAPDRAEPDCSQYLVL